MSSISTLVSKAIATFESLEHAAEAHRPDGATSVRSNLTRFKLWAGSVGAHRPYGHRSLEYRLSGTSIIRGHVVTLLEDLCTHLEEAQTVLRKDSQEPEDKSQQDDGLLSDYFADDEPDVDDFQQVLLQIKNDVNCLMRLAITIRNPAPHEQFKGRVSVLVSSFDVSHTEHVRHKFPRLQPEMTERLGKALTYRRLFLRYREDHHERLTEGIGVEGADKQDEKEEIRDGVTTEASWLPKDNPGDDGPPPRIWRDDLSEQTGTSYAPSCVDDSELRIPRIPPEYVDGPFICPYCFLPISIENRYQWKKHVFSDLRPYNCLEPRCPCGETGFVRRKDWFSHIVREHWRAWICPLGCAELFPTSSPFSEHMSQKHGLATTPLEVDSSSIDDLTRAHGKCPLCWEYDIVSSRQYQSHVGHHLEQLALFVLPGADESEEQADEEENGVSQNESHETEDEGQPTDDYDREQDSLSSGSPKPNAVNEVNNVLDVQQSDKNSERSSGFGELKATQASKDEVTSSFGEHVVSPSMDEGNRTLPEDSLALVAEQAEDDTLIIEQEGKTAEEGARLPSEDEWLRRWTEGRDNAERNRIQRAASKQEREEAEKAAEPEKDPIKFKDAVGRKFNFPWNLCTTWTSMEDLIKQAFAHVEVIGPRVQEGHYDLIGPDGEIILPVVWEKTVQPGWSIYMRMWPLDEQPLEDRRLDKDRLGNPPPAAPGERSVPAPGMVDVVDGARPEKKSRKAKKPLGFFAGASPRRRLE